MTIDALILAGTGFPEGGDGICETFLAHLDERFLPQIVRYPADFGGRMAWAQSRAAGRQALIDAIRATNNLAVIGGYSQGAGIAGDLAAEIGAGKHPGLEVVGCALIADPKRPIGGGLPGERPTSGYGIVGQRPIPKIPTWWAAVEGDPITSCPACSPLRLIADAADYFSLSSGPEALHWGLDLYTKALNRGFQPWWSLKHWRGWGGANRLAWGYLPRPVGGGLHTTALLEQGLLVRLAHAVNRGVR